MSSVEQPLVQLVGVVEELAIGGASKQARRGPVLVTGEGPVSVFVLGDNPFAPSQLAQWLGQRVTVSGLWRGTTLRVEADAITALPLEPDEAAESGESNGGPRMVTKSPARGEE